MPLNCPISSGRTDSKFRNKEGIQIVNDYKTAIAILKDSSFRVPDLHTYMERLEHATGNTFPSLKRFIHNTPFFLEGERHQELRSICLKYFGPSGLRPWNNFITQQIDLIIDRALQKNEFDIIDTIAQPIFTEICRPMLGLCPRETKTFDAKAGFLQRLIEPMLSLNNLKGVELDLEWMQAQVMDPPRETGNQPVTIYASLLAEPLEGYLDEDKTALAIALYALVTPLAQTIPNILAMLYQGSAENAVSCDQFSDQMDYCLHRAASPVYIQRIAGSDCCINGLKVAAGNIVMIELATAFSSNAGAGSNAHDFTFGYGKHLCIGIYLSKRIISELIPKFLKAFPTLEIIEIKQDANNHILNALSTFTVKRSAA